VQTARDTAKSRLFAGKTHIIQIIEHRYGHLSKVRNRRRRQGLLGRQAPTFGSLSTWWLIARLIAELEYPPASPEAAP
jgi:hypothetical protein